MSETIPVKYLLLLLLLLFTACRGPQNFGFFQPMTLSLVVPDGPPEYKSGWYYGCKSGLANGQFQNSMLIYRNNGGPDFGPGVYQHDQKFVTGYGQGWFSCVVHSGTFVALNSMKHGPLE